MAHHDLWGWADPEALAARSARRLKSTLLLAKEQYDSWLVYKASRSDADIASAEGWSAGDVTVARLALEAVKELFDFADNNAGTLGDRLTPMRDAAFNFITKNDLVAQVRTGIRGLIDAMVSADEDFAEWISFAAGRSDADIATALASPATTVLVTDVKVALRSGNQLFDYANNQTPAATRDRFEDWRILT